MDIRSIIKLVGKYVKYPISFKIALLKLIKSNKYKKLGLSGFEPNYVFFDRLNEKSNIIDVGCGFEAEFSVTLINKHNLKAFAVDPTHKHAPYLKKIEDKYPLNFKHLQYALSAENGSTVFYEAEHCESGSLLNSHKNVLNDNITEYNVTLIDLPELLKITGLKKVDLLKIDIEGAEYTLFNDKNIEALKFVDQLFVEFHHISVKNYSNKDTLNIVKKIENAGFDSFCNDGLNYLFYKK
jgi:FkbM family methyltransferase